MLLCLRFAAGKDIVDTDCVEWCLEGDFERAKEWDAEGDTE
jgi:hypothetical protein